MSLLIKDLGLMPYSQALQEMVDWHSAVLDTADHPGVLLVVEHPPTITVGKRMTMEDVHMTPEEMKKNWNVDFCCTDRGGGATVHEPGQLVVYPILSLQRYQLSVKKYVCILERSMIDVCQQFGIKAHTDTQYPGVWVGLNKIGALGIRVDRHITRHGLALNVCNSLETFRFVTPCGIFGRGVTSLLKEAKDVVDPEEVKHTLLAKLVSFVNLSL